ncbi:MAG TPA: hypothetical protein VGR04_06680 [Acidimicrobiia bacterium]|nr:hypothetical protein [Acidimicrobiia bacterium]
MTTTGQALRARGWRRIFHLHADRLGQKIPPLDALRDEMDKRIATGESEEGVTLAVVEDFEKSAATVNARTTPLVPASGIVVTGAGILANASGQGEAAKVVALFAMAFALGGLGFLATALFTHAGRPSVGFAPTRADVAFVHDRLIKKESNAQVGSMLTGVGFVVLLVVIL